MDIYCIYKIDINMYMCHSHRLLFVIFDWLPISRGQVLPNMPIRRQKPRADAREARIEEKERRVACCGERNSFVETVIGQ